jgi:hypothetical protein
MDLGSLLMETLHQTFYIFKAVFVKNVFMGTHVPLFALKDKRSKIAEVIRHVFALALPATTQEVPSICVLGFLRHIPPPNLSFNCSERYAMCVWAVSSKVS